jgi:hypothetical protein
MIEETGNIHLMTMYLGNLSVDSAAQITSVLAVHVGDI